jgi:hypothetical protein
MNNLITLLILLLVTSVGYTQVLVITISSISSTPEGKLGRAIEGEWIFEKAEINGESVLDSFEGIVLTIPKCSKADRKEGGCPPVEVSGDEKTDYFKDLFGENFKYAITSRKAINKAAKAEDVTYEKVMYEVITTENSEVEYAFKYKKKTMYIEAKSEGVMEVFELVQPPKEKKK